MDEIARFNKARWEELASANVEFSRPFLDLDVSTARARLDPSGVMGEVNGRNVLCLAAGGGQQSAAFALLGASVTVFDLSSTQLQRDEVAASHYNVDIHTVQGDMRDLTAFADNSFDIVYHAYSITFVPDVRPVFKEVQRVIRHGGLYRVEWANPFTQTIDDEKWTGDGYLLTQAYIDGWDVTEKYPFWDVHDLDGTHRKIQSPKEYVHTLSTVINSLVETGFSIKHVSENTGAEEDPIPGTWPHFMKCAAPWLTIWSRQMAESDG